MGVETLLQYGNALGVTKIDTKPSSSNNEHLSEDISLVSNAPGMIRLGRMMNAWRSPACSQKFQYAHVCLQTGE